VNCTTPPVIAEGSGGNVFWSQGRAANGPDDTCLVPNPSIRERGDPLPIYILIVSSNNSLSCAVAALQGFLVVEYIAPQEQHYILFLVCTESKCVHCAVIALLL
jgi:hypothetical protein